MKKTKVMIVEDEGLVARDIETMVKSLGYSVCDVISSGEQAIARAQKNRPDLILMDITLMGQIDGIDAAEKIRQLTHIPIVFLTAHTDEPTFQRAKVTAPFGYTLKPIELNELKNVIEMALYKHDMETKLREREEWLSAILINIGEGVIVTNLEGHVTFMNTIAEQLTGWTQESSIDKPLCGILNLISEETNTRIDISFRDFLEKSQGLNNHRHIIILNKDQRIPVEISMTAIKDETGETSGLVLVLRDITERKRHEEQLHHMAIHDPLTGLPNRSLFYDRLNLFLAQVKRHTQKIAMFMLDLDYFKKVNDSYGHHTGDKLLQGVSERLKTTIRESDTFARWGGDEFVMLFPEIANDEDVIPIAQRIRQIFYQPFDFEEGKIEITASIGISVYPEDGEDAETLIKNADRAMYKVKEQGRGTFRFFMSGKDSGGIPEDAKPPRRPEDAEDDSTSRRQR